MYKNTLMVFAVFLLSAGMTMAEEMNEEEAVDAVTVDFTGVAVEFIAGEMPGAPTIWTVNVSADEENDFCSDIINVTVYQATSSTWGTYDENVVAGDSVEVFGVCVMDDETGCIAAVTLDGSEDYYLALAEEETEVAEVTEVAETEDGEVVDEVVAEETEEETVDGEVVEETEDETE